MNVPGMREGSALSGPLAGAGSDLVRATVLIAPVPGQPPAALADVVQPVYGHDARLVDWKLASQRNDVQVHADDITTYREWRAAFAAERFIGERALISAFLDWLRPQVDTRTLDILRLPEAHVDFHAALQIRLQVDRARSLVEASEDIGYGLFTASGHRGPIRALIPQADGKVLLTTAESALSLSRHGLLLKPDLRSNGDALRILGWTSGDTFVRAVTPNGEVELGESAAARLLRVAGRHAEEVEVRACPLATLLAPLLVFLRDATQLAGETGADLHLRGGGS